MQINLDITLHNYPCAMLSLDKMDVLHSHIMDVEENLKKIRVNTKNRQIAQYKNRPGLSTQDRIEIIKEQVSNNEGCRVKGDFMVK